VPEEAASAVEPKVSATVAPIAAVQAPDVDPETSWASSFRVLACLDFPWLTPVDLKWLGGFTLKDITS
jgi:hypothetical protein